MMRYFLLLSFAVLMITSCGSGNGDKLPADVVRNPKSATGNENGEKMPAIAFQKMTHDFGRLIMGEKVSYAFKFTNTGSADLMITNVSTSCGCTVPTYTNKPIKPGDQGILTVSFDSSNRKGFQNKTITVVTNTQPNTTVLSIIAMVATPVQN